LSSSFRFFKQKETLAIWRIILGLSDFWPQTKHKGQMKRSTIADMPTPILLLMARLLQSLNISAIKPAAKIDIGGTEGKKVWEKGLLAHR